MWRKQDGHQIMISPRRGGLDRVLFKRVPIYDRVSCQVISVGAYIDAAITDAATLQILELLAIRGKEDAAELWFGQVFPQDRW